MEELRGFLKYDWQNVEELVVKGYCLSTGHWAKNQLKGHQKILFRENGYISSVFVYKARDLQRQKLHSEYE